MNYSNELVEALKSITGQPSYIECQIKKATSKPVHERFTRINLNLTNRGLPIPARIEKLEQQVASLEAELKSLKAEEGAI